jgi:hypothetical protein
MDFLFLIDVGEGAGTGVTEPPAEDEAGEK